MRLSYGKLVDDVALPPMALVRKQFDIEPAADLVAAVKAAFAHANVVGERIEPGILVVLTVGSCGRASLPELVRTIVVELKARGAKPFIDPSMGSHGGATAEGQISVLAHLGITEESVNCEIHSSMEIVEICVLENGMSVQIDKLAYEADGIVLFNRIKPRNAAFRSDNESGLINMPSIGLGKQSGTDNCHAWGVHYLGRFIVEIDVTDKREGNANGVARADVITERLFQRFDREKFYTNSLTSGVLIAASISHGDARRPHGPRGGVENLRFSHPCWHWHQGYSQFRVPLRL